MRLRSKINRVSFSQAIRMHDWPYLVRKSMIFIVTLALTSDLSIRKPSGVILTVSGKPKEEEITRAKMRKKMRNAVGRRGRGER